MMDWTDAADVSRSPVECRRAGSPAADDHSVAWIWL
jgi:hypothetical protein